VAKDKNHQDMYH